MNDTKFVAATESHELQMVKAFMEKAGQDTPEMPTIPDSKTNILRARLILEEALETIEAMGLKVVLFEDADFSIDINNVKITNASVPNMVKVIDGLCDIIYVVLGTFVAYGIPDRPFVEEVCHNNLTKVHPKCYMDQHGKVQKPPGYVGPELEKLYLQYLETIDTNNMIKIENHTNAVS